jgi:hypothetical protein
MKYLNTKYPDLFDSAYGCDISHNLIRNAKSGSSNYCIKNISNSVSTTSIYLKFYYISNYSKTTISPKIVDITTSSSANLVLYENASQLKLTNNNNGFSWSGDVPSTTASVIDVGYHQREITIHFDTVQNLAELYSDGVLYASVTCANNGETIQNVKIGGINISSSILYSFYFGNVIISDSSFPITETVTEITPTITTTDWLVSANNEASTDDLGSVMTLTAPSGSIDETKKTVTGYSTAFMNGVITSTINAVNVTQGANTNSVLLQNNRSVETVNPFVVTQLSDISATVTSTYVSQ